MNGLLLRKFLYSCEAQGIIVVCLENAGVSLETKLEIIWAGLSAISGTDHDQDLSFLDNMDHMYSGSVRPNPTPEKVCVSGILGTPDATKIEITDSDSKQPQLDPDSALEGKECDLHANEEPTQANSFHIADNAVDSGILDSAPLDNEADCVSKQECEFQGWRPVSSGDSFPSELFDLATPSYIPEINISKKSNSSNNTSRSWLQKSIVPDNISTSCEPPLCSTPVLKVENMPDLGSNITDTSRYSKSGEDVINLARNKSNSSDTADYILPSIDLPAETKSNNSSFAMYTTAPTHRELIHESDDREGILSDAHVLESSDDSDEKLERLFTNMRLKTEQRKTQTISRKSLSVFIVSDSEEIEISDEETKGITPEASLVQSPIYQTPVTPGTGLMFWGSPSEHKRLVAGQTRKAFTRARERLPLGQKDNFFTPIVSSIKPASTQSLTTPSSHKYYPRFKNNMLKELFHLFNKTIFDNKLLEVEVQWSKRLRTTAGFCKYRGLQNSRTASIELSTKVLDDFDRLRDTLLHEMCHAACWIIDGNKKAGHGPQWLVWANKALQQHPGLKPVTRCHDYEISYKYTYKCSRCDFKIGRHSKSLNVHKSRCPYCQSEMVLQPRLRSDGTPFMKRKLSKYAQFVKDNYHAVKEASPGLKHPEILEKIKALYHQTI